jgi:uncharacterized membrane protein YfhO
MADTKEKSVWFKRLYKYIIVFLIPVICMIIHMVMKECYPFGDNTILIGDTNSQYYAFFMELAERIKNGNSIFFSWEKGMGYDFYSNFFYYLASPFNIIAMLFGRSHMELGMIVTMLTQVGFCGVTMLYFFSHTELNKMAEGKLNDAVCILFAIAYAMCDFIVAYQYNIIWLISLVLLPIVMLGIERLVTHKDVRLYFISLFLTFVTNYYFSWFICIFAVIWFIDQNKSGVKDFFGKLLRFAITSIVAAMCAAIILIPCYLAVLTREDADGWGSLSNYSIATFGNIGNFIQSFFWGHDIDTLGSYMFIGFNYCGIFTIVLCLAFVFASNKNIKSKIKRILEMLFLALCMNWIATQYVLHGFTFPHLFNNRFSFMIVIMMLITAFECITSYEDIRMRWIAVMAIIYVCGIVVVILKNEDIQNIICYMVSILIIVYLLMILVLSRRKSIKKSSVIINIIIVGFAEIISNFFAVSGDSLDISMERWSSLADWQDKYEQIESENMERKTSWMLSCNDITHTDTNIFSSSLNSNLLWLFDSVGLVYQNNGGSYIYRGATPVTALMFNVRNVLTDHSAYYGGYTEKQSYTLYSDLYDKTVEYGIYETDYADGLGYVVSDDISSWDTDNKNPFEVQNNFVKSICGIDDVFTKVKVDSLQDFTVKTNGCLINKKTDTILDTTLAAMLEGNKDNVYMYQNLNIAQDHYAVIQYSFVVPEDMQLYVYIQDDKQIITNFAIDGEAVIADNQYPGPGEMLYLGDLKEGQKVVINVSNRSDTLDYGTTVIDFYEYHDDKMQECMKSLEGKSMVLEETQDTYIRGSVTAETDGILFTSIPNFRGFSVYVDGEKTDIVPLGNDALIGVKLTAGEHTIELRYIPYGFVTGSIVSFAGLCILAAYVIILRRRKRGEIVSEE